MTSLTAPQVLVSLCASGLMGLHTFCFPAAVQAQPWGWAMDSTPSPSSWTAHPPVRGGAYGAGWARNNPGPETVYDNDPSNWASNGALTQAQIAERCNLGRLVGGLIGGGVGYAASRQEGRSWAVPLGALLGSQMGCGVGAGRGPVPW